MLKYEWGESISAPCALLLGGFDGLHSGHETLLARARKSGLPVALTTITGVKAGGEVFTLSEREALFEREGVAYLIVLSYEKIKDIAAHDFLRALFANVNAQAVFCGEDFTFGKNAAGTTELLRRSADIPVEVLPLKRINGKKVSTSSVKRYLQEGDLLSANALLASKYFIRGEVEHGRQVGRRYGFPTANVTFSAEKSPLREGVYLGTVEADQKEYPSIINVGARPTFALAEKKVEAYLADFCGDLYGKTVTIYPEEFLRPIVRFENAERLKEQLQYDLTRLKERKRD